MVDLAWDADARELKLDDSGDLILVDGVEEAAQSVSFTLDSNFAEFEFAPTEGLRWQQVLGHRSEDLTIPGAELKRCILGVEGVVALEAFELVQEGDVLLVEFTARFEGGATVQAEGSISDDGEIDLLLWVI